MSKLLHSFYTLSLWQMVISSVIVIIAVGMVNRFMNKKNSMRVCWSMAACYLLVIVFATLVGRSGGLGELILEPFNNFAEAKVQPEMYRSMLANVCLFVPLGALVGCALAESKLAASLKTRNIIALTAMIGLGVSLVIEIVQYAYGIGRAEVDDLICNTAGMAVGSLSLIIGGRSC